jgi:hypothetical protein
MRAMMRLVIGLMVLVWGSAGFGREAAKGGSSDEAGWVVLFRADDSLIWNKDVGDASAANGFAMKVDRAPQKVKFLRFKRIDSGEAVIVPIKRDQLTVSESVAEDLVWSAGSQVRGPQGAKNKLLGIAKKSWSATKAGEHLVMREPNQMNRGSRGWGFSKEAGQESAQTYSWAGGPIAKTVFEIAVKSGELSDEEKGQLLSGKSVADAGEGQGPSVGNERGPTTKIARKQTSIRGLTVTFDSTGMMTGGTLDVILTASGSGKGPVNVSFATPVGHQMHLVLDDVLRSIRQKYPNWDSNKVELTFDDRQSKLDGPSAGAAFGTLVLSAIDGFEIDPKLAMTGDVTADGKVRKIGGVVAKTRGATRSGCSVIAVPSGNYDQLVDGLVYEGPGLLTDIQAIGIGSLDEAAAVGRLERDGKLKEAMALYGEVQEILKKTPDRVKSKEVQEKLEKVVELWPEHLSGKIMLMVSQDKQPKKLSSFASMYYTSVAIRGMLPQLYERGKKKVQINQATMNEGLKSLEKVRRLADPSVYPLVDAWKGFFKAVSDAAAGHGSAKELDAKGEAVENAAVKLNANREAMEKMLREGI